MYNSSFPDSVVLNYLIQPEKCGSKKQQFSANGAVWVRR